MPYQVDPSAGCWAKIWMRRPADKGVATWCMGGSRVPAPGKSIEGELEGNNLARKRAGRTIDVRTCAGGSERTGLLHYPPPPLPVGRRDQGGVRSSCVGGAPRPSQVDGTSGPAQGPERDVQALHASRPEVEGDKRGLLDRGEGIGRQAAKGSRHASVVSRLDVAVRIPEVAGGYAFRVLGKECLWLVV